MIKFVSMTAEANAVYERWTRVVPEDDEPDVVGVQVAPASNEALDAFQARFGLELPSSFRALYALSNGTSTMDGDENVFWSLTAMSNVRASFEVEDPTAHWVAFADFRLQSSTYYLRLDRKDGGDSVWLDAPKRNVQLIDRAVRIADSFAEFLTRYAESPLYWKKKQKEKKATSRAGRVRARKSRG